MESDMKRINMYISAKLLSDIDKEADSLHITRSACICMVLSEWVSNRKALSSMSALLDSVPENVRRDLLLRLLNPSGDGSQGDS